MKRTVLAILAVMSFGLLTAGNVAGSFKEAKKMAAAKNKPILIDFYIPF